MIKIIKNHNRPPTSLSLNHSLHKSATNQWQTNPGKNQDTVKKVGIDLNGSQLTIDPFLKKMPKIKGIIKFKSRSQSA
jgi:hypothetical protein